MIRLGLPSVTQRVRGCGQKPRSAGQRQEGASAVADQMKVQGTLVACEERAYGSFTDRQTGEVRPGGFTRWAYLVGEFDQAPVVVKVGAQESEAWLRLNEAGYGADVLCTVALRAVGQGAGAQIQRQLLVLDEVTAVADPFEEAA